VVAKWFVKCGLGFWVLGSGFWVLGSGFWVLGLGVIVEVSWFEAQGSVFRVSDLGCEV